MTAGRPTKYYEEICQEMLDFFDDAGTMTLRDGRTVDKLPTFEKFATMKNLCVDTLHAWKNDENKPEFSEAYKICQQKQKEFLIQRGLAGDINTTFAIFVSKNITDMKDKTEVDSNNNHNIVVMGSVKKDGKKLSFNIGTEKDDD